MFWPFCSFSGFHKCVLSSTDAGLPKKDLLTSLSAPIGELLHFTLKIFVLIRVRVSFGLSPR